MMVKIPKFKILEALSLPAIPRSTPQLPEFQEFLFETAVRANQNAETASVASTEVSQQKYGWNPHHLTEPKSPFLHTTLRARPPTEGEKLFRARERGSGKEITKLKARPLNKKQRRYGNVLQSEDTSHHTSRVSLCH